MATYKYTYNFAGGNYNGATIYSQIYDTSNLDSSVVVTPSREGYELRWFTITASSDPSQIGLNAAPGQKIGVPANITLTAVWDKVHYLQYDLNGGYYEASSDWKYKQEKKYGSNVSLFKVPLRTGYTFGGWKDHKHMYNGAVWEAGQAWGADVDCELQAVWTRNSTSTYTITFALDGGTGASNQTLQIGTNYTLPVPIKTGYEFVHWKSNRDNNYDGSVDIYQAGATYSKSNNVTFTAVWKEASNYNVTYYRPQTESGAGSGITDGYWETQETKQATSFTVTNGNTTYIFGHTNKGWLDHFIPQPIYLETGTNLFSFMYASPGYLHKTDGTLVSNQDTDERASDYIAVTAGQKYTYSYHMDYRKIVGNKKTPAPWTRIWFYTSSKALISGSMIEISETDYDASGENTYHHVITVPSGAAYARISSRYLRYGYAQFVKGSEFRCWTLNDSDVENLYQAYDSYANEDKKDVFLLGVYTPNEKTITFNANGGTGAPATQKTWYGRTLPLPTTKPTREHYDFLGWATDPQATEATWNAGADFIGQNNDFTLYAVWKKQRSIHVYEKDNNPVKGVPYVYIEDNVPVRGVCYVHDGIKWNLGK